jgi:septal ring factor EnvC (AmiA/AmiB activator)
MQTSEGDINGGAVVVEKPVRWSKDRLAKLEDLELALDAAVHVNRYLNKEIEAVVQQLQRAEQERHAWQEHARRLARQLAKYKRAAAGVGFLPH